MGGTYKATGINLKSMPLGESDRLLTILTREMGLVRAVSPGSRKHQSSLRGRSNLFVINNLLLVKGRTLDRVVQAESVESFPLIGNDLGKLTAGQYLAELALFQALSDHPQPDLFNLLWEHLSRLNGRSPSLTLMSLVQAIYHFLAYGGLTPQVFRCCVTQKPIIPDWSNPDWHVHFDAASGGIVAQHNSSSKAAFSRRNTRVAEGRSPYAHPDYTQTYHSTEQPQPPSLPASVQTTPMPSPTVSLDSHPRAPHPKTQRLSIQLNAKEVTALQRLAQTDILKNSAMHQEDHDHNRGIPMMMTILPDQGFSKPSDSPDALPTIAPGAELQTWLSLERVLRHYVQYYFEQPIRSAALIDTCFLTV